MTSGSDQVFDIRERSFQFALRIVNLCSYLDEHRLCNRLIINQLLDAGTSVGANLEEAAAGQTPRDFIHKNAISLKEARESKYWLRLISATAILEEPISKGVIELEQEARELSQIIVNIIVN